MKKLLTIAVLSFPALVFAQQKSGSFIKEHLYVKVSPALMTVSVSEHLKLERGLTPAIYGSVGARMRYAALGFSAGYFNLRSAGSIAPWGVDLTLTDFKRKKAFPVITAQWHRAHFKEEYTIGSGGRSTFDITGKNMFSINGGIAFRALKTSRIMVTLGYSKLRANTTIFTQYQGIPGLAYYAKDHLEMFVLATGIVL